MTVDKKYVWRHNSFIGYARRMELAAAEIHRSKSANAKAKLLAEKIANLARELQAELRKERIDQ